NTRYVGALSSTLDKLPDAQKKCGAVSKPSSLPFAPNICNAGCMQMKIPTNKAATSIIAPYAKRLASRTLLFPNRKEIATKQICTISRKYNQGCQSVPGNGLLGSSKATANTT